MAAKDERDWLSEVFLERPGDTLVVPSLDRLPPAAQLPWAPP